MFFFFLLISVYKTLHYMIIHTLDNGRLFRYCLGYLLFRYSPWYNSLSKNRWLPVLVIILHGSCCGSLHITWVTEAWCKFRVHSSRAEFQSNMGFCRLMGQQTALGIAGYMYLLGCWLPQMVAQLPPTRAGRIGLLPVPSKLVLHILWIVLERKASSPTSGIVIPSV